MIFSLLDRLVKAVFPQFRLKIQCRLVTDFAKLADFVYEDGTADLHHSDFVDKRPEAANVGAQL